MYPPYAFSLNRHMSHARAIHAAFACYEGVAAMKESLMSSSKDSEQTAAAVVVTGVSTGIGWGTVKVLVGHGVHVYGGPICQDTAWPLFKESSLPFKQAGSA